MRYVMFAKGFQLPIEGDGKTSSTFVNCLRRHNPNILSNASLMQLDEMNWEMEKAIFNAFMTLEKTGLLEFDNVTIVDERGSIHDSHSNGLKLRIWVNIDPKEAKRPSSEKYANYKDFTELIPNMQWELRDGTEIDFVKPDLEDLKNVMNKK